MQKEIIATITGQRADIGEFKINRIVGTRNVRSVGPIVFLDHATPMIKTSGIPALPDGHAAHPHRGIATFGYVISGEIEHFDSRGNHGVVGAGGAQWMKAGNGIIHDEGLSQHFQKTGGTMHMLQFWLNLPPENKTEEPAYTKLAPDEIPEILLAGNDAKLRVLIGSYRKLVSKITTYNPQFIYELWLEANAECTVEIQAGSESAAYLTEGEAEIAGTAIKTGVLAMIKLEGELLKIKNNSVRHARIFIFGGERYNDPIVAEGPFVMNSHEEISRAYLDYQNGKYGEIDYEKSSDLT